MYGKYQKCRDLRLESMQMSYNYHSNLIIEDTSTIIVWPAALQLRPLLVLLLLGLYPVKGKVGVLTHPAPSTPTNVKNNIRHCKNQ